MSGTPTNTFDTTLGAAFIGFSFALVLYGVTCLQTIIYFHKWKSDTLLLRAIVLILWMLDVLHTILVSHGTYTILVTDHLTPFQAVAKPPWGYSVQVYVTVISNLLVRSVYSIRIYRLSHGNIVIPILVTLLSLYVVATGLVFGTEALHAVSWLSIKTFSWSLYSGYGAEMLADATIAVSMCTMLFRMRTGLQSSDTLVQTLVMYSINTGLMTTICVFLSLVTYATLPDTFAFLACYFVLSKVYVNSLLGSLNARSKMHEPTHNKALLAKADLSGGSSSRTNSDACTSGGSGPSVGVLTTAIVLGTMDVGTESEGEAYIHAFEQEREKSKHSTPRSGYARLEDV